MSFIYLKRYYIFMNGIGLIQTFILVKVNEDSYNIKLYNMLLYSL